MLTLMFSPSFAKGFNKCTVDGKIVYTHKNCLEKQDRVAVDKGTFSDIGNGVSDSSSFKRMNTRASGDVPRQVVEMAGEKEANSEIVQELIKDQAQDKQQGIPSNKEVNESE